MIRFKKSVCILLSLLTLLSAAAVLPVSVSAETYKEIIKLKAGENAYIDSNPTISWSNSDKSVVKVSKGSVIALIKGTAIITATKSNGEIDKYKVIVTTNPQITGKRTKVEKLSSFRIKVKGAVTKINYSSTKPKIASITSEGDITTKKVGTTTIKAKVNGITLSFKLKVYIKDIVTHHNKTINKGYIYSFYFSEVGSSPKMVSKNPKIVKVVKGGKIKGLKRGKATVVYSRKHVKAIVRFKVV